MPLEMPPDEQTQTQQSIINNLVWVKLWAGGWMVGGGRARIFCNSLITDNQTLNFLCGLGTTVQTVHCGAVTGGDVYLHVDVIYCKLFPTSRTEADLVRLPAVCAPVCIVCRFFFCFFTATVTELSPIQTYTLK